MKFDFDAGPTPRRAVTAEAEAEAGDVLEAAGAHYLLPPHHQVEDVAVAVAVAVDVGEEEDQVDVCPQLYQGAE